MTSGEDKYFRARILDRRNVAEDLWVVRVDPGGEFTFKPGQFATLGVVNSETRFERPYSIASAPHEGFLEFFFELVPQGKLTPKMHPLRTGDEFTLRRLAKGKFILDTTSGRTNHLLLATVTGVVPFVSYVRSLRHQFERGKFAGEHKLFLLQGASRSWELGYREEMERAALEYSWFTYIPTLSRPWEDPSWNGEAGRVDDVVRKYTDLWGLASETTTAYLCGHPSLIQNAKGILHRRGWNEREIKTEAYFVPVRENPAPPS